MWHRMMWRRIMCIALTTLPAAPAFAGRFDLVPEPEVTNLSAAEIVRNSGSRH